ncbi:MAG: FKBP-type peptidyl-prolyl cis-trans isomerase [Anaerolineales bacterium]|nr:FKBP-type peptidyl-prolyl cis-trans isomerase [Anaerolineales bacterium]
MKTDSGLQYIETEAGSGKAPKRGQRVAVHYIGRLENGKEFDNSVKRGEPIEFLLGTGQVIPGWDEGISLMKVGGKATLIIPPDLGYGARGAGGVIPPNATLIFDVELVDVK